MGADQRHGVGADRKRGAECQLGVVLDLDQASDEVEGAGDGAATGDVNGAVVGYGAAIVDGGVVQHHLIATINGQLAVADRGPVLNNQRADWRTN